MLYQAFDLQRGWLAGISAWANASSQILRHPANPLSYGGRSSLLASALDVFAHAAAPLIHPSIPIILHRRQTNFIRILFMTSRKRHVLSCQNRYFLLHRACFYARCQHFFAISLRKQKTSGVFDLTGEMRIVTTHK